jgi:hypothetical protein
MLEVRCAHGGPGFGDALADLVHPVVTGPYQTAVGPAEVLTQLRVPLPPGGGRRCRGRQGASRRE